MKLPESDNSALGNEEGEYDKYVGFYYTNLINSIVLFALTRDELEKLAEEAFDPMAELETEIDYAFHPFCFDAVFRNGLIALSYREELLAFKQETDNIPKEIWDWECLDENPRWIFVRQKANELLDKLGVENRTYNDDYTTVYDRDGNIVKKGKNL